MHVPWKEQDPCSFCSYVRAAQSLHRRLHIGLRCIVGLASDCPERAKGLRYMRNCPELRQRSHAPACHHRSLQAPRNMSDPSRASFMLAVACAMLLGATLMPQAAVALGERDGAVMDLTGPNASPTQWLDMHSVHTCAMCRDRVWGYAYHHDQVRRPHQRAGNVLCGPRWT
jgi:hypothetical protein